jgi:UDPglucose 6-dehydrogenase
MRVMVIGTGYVGLTTAIALAYVGHQVTAVDTDAAKVARLREGVSPIHEFGVPQLLNQCASRLHFTETLERVPDAEVIFIAVGTPPTATGDADLSFVENVARGVAAQIAPGQTCTLVVKSTVPIGTNQRILHLVERGLTSRGVTAQVSFASCPEFLREGIAMRDTFYPDRIVIGAGSPEAVAAVSRMYRPLLEQTFVPPSFLPRPEGYTLPNLVTTDLVSAEMTKYAANAFLALKISYINEIAGLCEKVGADVTEVARGIGLDSRIGHRFLNAGLGWGGSCFPKDTAALLAVSDDYNYTMPIIQAAREVNDRQRLMIIEKLQAALKVLRGRSVAVLGLAFKPNTDDVRDAPALELIRLLLDRGAHIHAHDPVAVANARRALAGLDVEFMDNPYDAVAGTDAVVLATEWDDYYTLDLPRLAAAMKQPVLIDGRNHLVPGLARDAGFAYYGVGR